MSDSDDSLVTRKSSSRRAVKRGEFDFIKRICQQEAAHLGKHSSLITHHSSLVSGIGDDAAVLRQRAGLDTIVTTDLLIEGIDFELGRFDSRHRRLHPSPRDVGHKALAVSLSDVAAMGARPRFCLLSVGVPRALWQSGFLTDFYRGVRALAARFGVVIIGGDTSRAPERVVVDSIVIGEVRRGRAVLRAGARAGDQIFVTGALGGAAAGLNVLEGERVRTSSAELTNARARLVKRQFRPEPRVEWGATLGERRLASALIDLSDGLSSDLAHVCRESMVGADIDAALLPFDPSLKSVVGDAGALALALNGGEDFELLFTVRPRNVSKLPTQVGGVRITRIGEVTDARGKLRLIRDGRAHVLKPRGFSHF